MEPLGKESLGYGPGTKERGILSQGSSISNSLDGKEHGDAFYKAMQYGGKKKESGRKNYKFFQEEPVK